MNTAFKLAESDLVTELNVAEDPHGWSPFVDAADVAARLAPVAPTFSQITVIRWIHGTRIRSSPVTIATSKKISFLSLIPQRPRNNYAPRRTFFWPSTPHQSHHFSPTPVPHYT